MQLAMWIKDHNLTLTEFANLIRTTPAGVHRWTTGRSIPSRPFMLAIYKATRGEVTANDFYRFPRPPKPPEPKVRTEAA